METELSHGKTYRAARNQFHLFVLFDSFSNSILKHASLFLIWVSRKVVKRICGKRHMIVFFVMYLN
jgi:hypothetical protein